MKANRPSPINFLRHCTNLVHNSVKAVVAVGDGTIAALVEVGVICAVISSSYFGQPCFFNCTNEASTYVDEFSSIIGENTCILEIDGCAVISSVSHLSIGPR
jgi:hypothetical protein